MGSKGPIIDERAKCSQTCENVHAAVNLDIHISLQLNRTNNMYKSSDTLHYFVTALFL